ncbi:MAG: hypothetical protein ABIG35_13270 [Pseudomonadota bacterium]
MNSRIRPRTRSAAWPPRSATTSAARCWAWASEASSDSPASAPAPSGHGDSWHWVSAVAEKV